MRIVIVVILVKWWPLYLNGHTEHIALRKLTWCNHQASNQTNMIKLGIPPLSPSMEWLLSWGFSFSSFFFLVTSCCGYEVFFFQLERGEPYQLCVTMSYQQKMSCYRLKDSNIKTQRLLSPSLIIHFIVVIPYVRGFFIVVFVSLLIKYFLIDRLIITKLTL